MLNDNTHTRCDCFASMTTKPRQTSDDVEQIVLHALPSHKLKYTTDIFSTRNQTNNNNKRQHTNMGDEVIIGLATGIAIAAARAAATNQAAEAEGITFEEMQLREKAARCRSRANTKWTARGRRNAAARAAACDEQLARFEETRRKKMMMNQADDNLPPSMRCNSVEYRFCNHCGAQNGVKANFCNECGTQQWHQGNYTTARMIAYNQNCKPDEKSNDIQ
jgi:ribosomal protein L40E